MISRFSNIARPDADQLSPVHRSEILLEDFLKPMSSATPGWRVRSASRRGVSAT
jgi:hypothetical protein